MIYLIDTNVLLRITNSIDSRYQIAQDAVHKLKIKGHQLQTTPQNLMEFWNVSMRPIDKNGLGYKPSETNRILQHLEQLFSLLPDSPDIYSDWKQLVVRYNVSGVQVFDARLVAVMNSHNVKHILFFNTSDFTRYVSEGTVAVDPETVNS